MRLNNKGFAISSILYMALVLFLILIMALLTMMSSRKTILDKSRKDTYNALNNIEEFETNINSDLDIAKPTMTDNMIPIVYSPSGVILKADVSDINPDENIYNPRNWYNYNQKKWANAVLVSSASLSKYQNLAPGENINQDDILAYFVWIPRYSYAVDSTNKIINVKFENKSVAKSTGTGTGTSYYTHPAFTFDSKELEGIWVGKFETSGGMNLEKNSNGHTGLKILPGVESISGFPPKQMFLNARKMELKGNIYGFPQSGTNNIHEILSCTTTIYGDNKCEDDTCMTYCGTIENDSNNIDSHVLKNTEWGAVALLSQSKYGINKSLDVNDNQNHCTGGGCQSISYIVNTNQSTTGNVYGIYDMSGGYWDFTMGYYGTISFKEDTLNNYQISNNYYDMYVSSTGIKGDATNNDNLTHGKGYFTFPTSGKLFTRGGNNADGVYAGIFTYYGRSYNGDQITDYPELVGFRISLAIWK